MRAETVYDLVRGRYARSELSEDHLLEHYLVLNYSGVCAPVAMRVSNLYAEMTMQNLCSILLANILL
jgi:hypothetical protein